MWLSGRGEVELAERTRCALPGGRAVGRAGHDVGREQDAVDRVGVAGDSSDAGEVARWRPGPAGGRGRHEGRGSRGVPLENEPVAGDMERFDGIRHDPCRADRTIGQVDGVQIDLAISRPGHCRPLGRGERHVIEGERRWPAAGCRGLRPQDRESVGEGAHPEHVAERQAHGARTVQLPIDSILLVDGNDSSVADDGHLEPMVPGDEFGDGGIGRQIDSSLGTVLRDDQEMPRLLFTGCEDASALGVDNEVVGAVGQHALALTDRRADAARCDTPLGRPVVADERTVDPMEVVGPDVPHDGVPSQLGADPDPGGVEAGLGLLEGHWFGGRRWRSLVAGWWRGPRRQWRRSTRRQGRRHGNACAG